MRGCIILTLLFFLEFFLYGEESIIPMAVLNKASSQKAQNKKNDKQKTLTTQETQKTHTSTH